MDNVDNFETDSDQSDEQFQQITNRLSVNTP